MISQTNGRGFTTTFRLQHAVSGTNDHHRCAGEETVHTYDASLRIMTITDPLGGVVGYGYDANNDRTSVTNQNGNTTALRLRWERQRDWHHGPPHE